MEVTRTIADGGVLVMKVDGRVDGYWADHLDAALASAVGEGHHRIALDCSKVSFLSSAGIGVMVKHHQQLGRISGGFRVVNPSPAVAAVLRITRLADVLIGEVAAVATTKIVAPPAIPRSIETRDLALDVFNLDPHGTLASRALGRPEALAAGTFTDADAATLEGLTPAFAVGIGAFGDSFTDCLARFGELVSVAGATAYQPADGTNVADYLIAKGPIGSAVRLLYGFTCDGAFSHLVRFEPLQPGAAITPSRLATACLDVAGSDTIGIVIVAETAGLVGAALRRSPAHPVRDGDFFAHPSVRTRLSFTTERAFPHSVSMSAGIVARPASVRGGAQLRPMGECQGHVHAAAFKFRPIQKGFIELPETIARLFEPDQLMGVMHLLSDDRGAAGAGESELIRGACWMAPLAA
jgi:anti-anti-sigma factor